MAMVGGIRRVMTASGGFVSDFVIWLAQVAHHSDRIAQKSRLAFLVRFAFDFMERSQNYVYGGVGKAEFTSSPPLLNTSPLLDK